MPALSTFGGTCAVALLDECRSGLDSCVTLLDDHPVTVTHTGPILVPQTAFHIPCWLVVLDFSELCFFLIPRVIVLLK